MHNFRDWLTESKQSADWLVLGKGPSFHRFLAIEHTLNGYITICLNHVVRSVRVNIAHFTDWEAYVDCAEKVVENADFVLFPYYPHVDFKPGSVSLPERIAADASLTKLSNQDRIIWYSSSMKPGPAPHPVITVKYFSADAVVSLLTSSGVQNIRCLGIDGGSSYDDGFADLSDRTLLSNTQQSFDIQFQAIAHSMSKSDSTLFPIGNIGIGRQDISRAAPIPIYVGTQPDQILAVKVLEYSIRKNTLAEVKLLPLCDANVEIPMPKNAKNRPRTPFSFQRFLIPQLNGFSGRAIYLDSDMLVFSDIAKLFTAEMQEADVASAKPASGDHRMPQHSVMLIDCAAAHWKIDQIVASLDKAEFTYEDLMQNLCVAREPRALLDPEWNSLEAFEAGKTHLLHYTDMPDQPWLTSSNRLSSLWLGELVEALNFGFIEQSTVLREIGRCHVRPGLFWHATRRSPNTQHVPFVYRVLDWLFVPPHRRQSDSIIRQGLYNLYKIVFGALSCLILSMDNVLYRAKKALHV